MPSGLLHDPEDDDIDPVAFAKSLDDEQRAVIDDTQVHGGIKQIGVLGALPTYCMSKMFATCKIL